MIWGYPPILGNLHFELFSMLLKPREVGFNFLARFDKLGWIFSTDNALPSRLGRIQYGVIWFCQRIYTPKKPAVYQPCSAVAPAQNFCQHLPSSYLTGSTYLAPKTVSVPRILFLSRTFCRPNNLTVGIPSLDFGTSVTSDLDIWIEGLFAFPLVFALMLLPSS